MNTLTNEQIREAREIDLLTYLRNYEPDKLVKISQNTYCTREHDSLKISGNGLWCWFSRGKGGKSALDYLIKVENYGFADAVRRILGKVDNHPPVSFDSVSMSKPDRIYMQPLNPSTDRIEAYLRYRGIHNSIIRYCLDKKILFETQDYHNVLFVGYDRDGHIRYAGQRGIIKDFKRENPGSDKRFSFNIESEADSDTLHVFEAAIDLLSYASLLAYEGKPWRRDHMLSLAGVYLYGSNSIQSALEHFLDEHPGITTIRLHLDNDEAGRKSSECIIGALRNRYMVFDEPPEEGKDVNDYLCLVLKERGKPNE